MQSPAPILEMPTDNPRCALMAAALLAQARATWGAGATPSTEHLTDDASVLLDWLDRQEGRSAQRPEGALAGL